MGQEGSLKEEGMERKAQSVMAARVVGLEGVHVLVS